MMTGFDPEPAFEATIRPHRDDGIDFEEATASIRAVTFVSRKAVSRVDSGSQMDRCFRRNNIRFVFDPHRALPKQHLQGLRVLGKCARLPQRTWVWRPLGGPSSWMY